MKANQYPGRCASCHVRVPAGAGWLCRVGSGWGCCCSSSACAQALGLQSAAVAWAITADGRVVGPRPSDEELAIIRGMPGRTWDRMTSTTRVSLALAGRPALLAAAERLGARVAPELRAYEDEEAPERARLEDAGLYPFQAEGVLWLRKRQRALLGDEPGLGKTVQVLLSLPERASAVVVCPASLKYWWRDECARWRPDLRPVVLAGRGSFRTPEPGELVIVNYDLLPPAPPKGETTRWGMDGVTLVADEATALKNGKSKRSKAFRALSERASKTWLLSGTPLANREMDLYWTLSAGQMSREVFGGWTGFIRCFQASKNRWGGWEFGAPLPEVPERLRRVMLRRRKDEVLTSLPPVQYRDVACNDLSPQLRLQLDQAWREWQEDSYNYDGNDEPSDLPPFERFSDIRAALAEARIPAMLELVEEHEECARPLVVFSAHRAPIDTLAGRDGWAVITGDTPAEQRQDVVRRFQDGQLKGVALTIQAGGYGLTLTRASDVLFVDQAWRPCDNQQAADRVRRIGQTASSIQVTRMVSEHPLDRHVLKLLSQKVALINAAVERLIVVKPRAQEGAWVEESEAAMLARREAAEQAWRDIERKAAQERIGRMLGEEQARGGGGNGAMATPITRELQASIVAAMDSMLGCCDGAKRRDDQGFNKPDAARSQWLRGWLEGDDEQAYRVAWLTLRRYPRQLQGSFPELFGGHE